MRKSRTYKLMLSDAGVSFYLSCHCRLAHLVCEFIPYGQTLGVAVAMLERLAPWDVAAEFDTRRFAQSCGNKPHFVGSSPELAQRVAMIRARLCESAEFSSQPTNQDLFIAALLGFESADDSQLLKAYYQLVS